MSVDVDLRVDVRGVCCPIPIIELTRAVQRLQTGQTLEIIGNDPVFESAIHNFCQANGHSVLQATTQPNQDIHFLIRIGGL